LAPEENEGVINWILEKEKDGVELEEIKIEKLALSQGISHWNKDFNPKVSRCARVLPSETMEGFFIAKIRKIASTLPSSFTK
jgi:16S rRNA C967 or C1407 C5-methylase (RsmB/RsmF family)